MREGMTGKNVLGIGVNDSEGCSREQQTCGCMLYQNGGGGGLHYLVISLGT